MFYSFAHDKNAINFISAHRLILRSDMNHNKSPHRIMVGDDWCMATAADEYLTNYLNVSLMQARRNGICSSTLVSTGDR